MKNRRVEHAKAATAKVWFGGNFLAAKLTRDEKKVLLTLNDPAEIFAG
ncbi:MAG TPA: hypothetical protein VKY92_13590 [Verrucomicrobiae bacterium]|nr:hypothetical protein [Verrucomicrobiae bacterium]